MGQVSDKDRLLAPITERDRIQGSLSSPVVLVEYGDYQCLYCGEAHRIIKEIQQQLNNQLCFVFRHFPQTQIHPQAQKAAEAAEAADVQGKFWQMHDTLFEHQHALDDGHLVEYANGIGLDISRFLQDMSGHVYANRVTEDIRSGVSSHVNSTPALFINGVCYKDAWEIERLLAAILKVGDFL
ncbi:thioredoxin domain-containing protein [Scytonema sp. UIC 10036]|uniref:DsbA family protein n=1 Tax=Scytonema sp. UIC 10036 TaxID=2304196 RepID=UPI0012DA75C0|nr:DsbA family protein [Scytonema sp. UIC 10036]MUG91950.1 thioredoxin domain-containing protein [Scytonema sp. UIC 10036]